LDRLGDRDLRVDSLVSLISFWGGLDSRSDDPLRDFFLSSSFPFCLCLPDLLLCLSELLCLSTVLCLSVELCLSALCFSCLSEEPCLSVEELPCLSELPMLSFSFLDSFLDFLGFSDVSVFSFFAFFSLDFSGFCDSSESSFLTFFPSDSVFSLSLVLSFFFGFSLVFFFLVV